MNSVFEVGYIYEKMRAFNDIVGLCYGYGTFAFEASAFEFQWQIVNDHQICSTQRAFTKSDKSDKSDKGWLSHHLQGVKFLFFSFFLGGGGYLVHGEICIEIKLATNSPSEGYPNHTFP